MKSINTSKNIALIAVAVMGVAAFAAGAHANDSAAEAPRRAVQYSDLDLNTTVGAKVLYQRIRRAAVQVCADVDPRRLAQVAAVKPCVDQAIMSSVRAVNRAQLTHIANAYGYEVQTAFNVAGVR